MTSARLLIAFDGDALPAATAKRIAGRRVAGVTLFRKQNIVDPAQVRALTGALQAAAPATTRPLLIGTDQEGGQLSALVGATPFAGAMALGAVGDEELAERVGRAAGRELRAMGINVDYAPVCDIASEPANPALGLRSFGDDPQAVARLTAATVRGLQAEGVAATAKHFPGLGHTTADPHHELPVIAGSEGDLEARELVPFRAAITAGVRLVMSGHVSLPTIGEGGDLMPASLSRAVVHDLLRTRLGFDGLTVTDALDMRALAQGMPAIDDVIAALRAGEDLLLGTADDALLARLDDGLAEAERRGLIDPIEDAAMQARLDDLRRWLARFDQLPLDVVACSEHEALAAELARRSVTLVRDDAGLLPIRLAADATVAVIQTRPADLTPADTSSTVVPTLAAAVRRWAPRVEELLLPVRPSPDEIGAVAERAAGSDVVIVGTYAAHVQPDQAALATAVIDAGRPTVTVALRTPWDLSAYPQALTHACTYGILPPSMEALAAALFGEIPFAGRLPVELAGLYPRGHGLTGQV